MSELKIDTEDSNSNLDQLITGNENNDTNDANQKQNGQFIRNIIISILKKFNFIYFFV